MSQYDNRFGSTQATQENAGAARDNVRGAAHHTAEALRNAAQSTGDNFRAAGQSTRERITQGTEGLKTSLLGGDGRRPGRYFRKAKAATLTATTRVLPERLDAEYYNNTFKAAAAEFIGLALFVFISAGSVEAFKALSKGHSTPAGVLSIAFAHGISLALAIALAASYSGGHINPAVTLAYIITGRLDIVAGIIYWVAQLLGAVVGAYALWFAWGNTFGLGAHTFGPGISDLRGLFVESVLTFILVATVWATAVAPRGNKTLAPLFIGLSVFVNILFGAALTGPSMNPARTFGPAFVTGIWGHQWVYWVGPFIGAILAGLLYETVFIRNSVVDEETDEIYEEILGQEEAGAGEV